MSKTRPTIYLDLDEVICAFLDQLCFKYNEQYNKNLKPNDIKTYSLSNYLNEDGMKIFHKPGFFMSLQPIDKSIETIRKLLNENHNIFIISSPMNEHCVFEKYLWVKIYLPFFPIRNLILVGNKGELLSRIDDENGVLFDDCPAYLREFNGIRVVMDREYNKELIVGDNVNGVDYVDYRVSGWDEFYEIVSGL